MSRGERWLRSVLLWWWLPLSAACSDDGDANADGDDATSLPDSSASGASSPGGSSGSGDDGEAEDSSGGGEVGGSSGGEDGSSGGSDDGTGGDAFDAGLCGEAPPGGSPVPPPPPAYSGGACPMLQPGYNTGFVAGGLSREFALIVPDAADATGTYPLLFAWYHISGNAMDFVDEVDAQALADEARAIIVVPQDSGMFDAKWPDTPLDIGQSGVDLAMFDDLYACISQQFAINSQCVSSIGVSAGGLWTSYLGTVRGQYLASDLTISGGHPTEFVGPWWPWTAPRKFAALVMWGGPSDMLGIDFNAASLHLVDEYTGNGNFLLRCEHTGGHGLPPPGDGDPLATAIDFVRNHPYWLDGASPLDMGLPDFYPSFCTVI
ncbi:MAG: hypothetical protein U0168_17695 [Nannocystaceae bacterium]